MQDAVRIKTEDGTEVTHTREFAESHGLKILEDKAALGRDGRALDPKYPVDLRGAELDTALEQAGLPKGGTAAEKRERLSDHQTSGASGVGNQSEEATR